MGSGVLCVITSGTTGTLMLCVENWDMMDVSAQFLHIIEGNVAVLFLKLANLPLASYYVVPSILPHSHFQNLFPC